MLERDAGLLLQLLLYCYMRHPQEAMHLHTKPLSETCCRVVGPLGDKLEEFIFEHGVETLRRHLCIEQARLCSFHQLYDSGEL